MNTVRTGSWIERATAEEIKDSARFGSKLEQARCDAETINFDLVASVKVVSK